MTPRVLVVTALLASLSAPAAAQELHRPWLDPDATDIDADAEGHSLFWERAIEPNKDEWKLRVARAEALMRQPDKQSIAEAEALLRDAIRLAPDQPTAHWYLGQAYYVQGKFEACAEARKKTASLDPTYEVPPLSRAPSSLDFGIGVCLSLSGDHAAALRYLKRTLAQGDDSTAVSYAIRWRLGETYMALGRLDEAIGALREAVRLGGMDVTVHYALATAYDRNEQSAAAATAMQEALKRDSTQSLLARKDLHISPAEDVYYYDALAKMQPPLPGRRTSQAAQTLSTINAILKFRHFVAEHGKGPWARRALHHIAALGRESLSAASAAQIGGAGLAEKPVRAAIDGAHAELQRCVAATPGVRYMVAITSLTRPRRGARAEPGQAEPTAGVRTQSYEEMETDPAAVATANECLDRVASDLALPAARGPAGESVTLRFYVVAQ